MNFFERRKYRKWVKQLLQEAQHACNMREDIAEPKALEELARAKQAFIDAWEERSIEKVDPAGEALANAIETLYPTRSHPKFRENLEILVVALAVAMAFRTYFIQPFKIPTGSMQPTLYGITYEPQTEKTWADRFPMSLFKMMVLGTRYTEVRATTSGYVSLPSDARFYQNIVIYINQIAHQYEKGLVRHFELGDYVEKGDLLASGTKTYGDHIFVDKIRYFNSNDLFLCLTQLPSWEGVR